MHDSTAALGRFRAGLLCLLSLSLFASVCAAQDDDAKWSITPYIGASGPSLNGINDGVFQAPVIWSGDIVVQSGTAGSTSQPENVTIFNPLPRIKSGTEAGVEIAYELSPANSLIFGYSSFEGSSSSTAKTVLPFQGVFSQVYFQRTGDFTYNAFHIGWQHRMFADHGKWRFTTQVALRELFDISYQENEVYLFQTGPAQSFKRILQFNPRSTGSTMLRLGIGGEYFFTNWLSVGLRMGYSASAESFALNNNANAKNDFQTNDQVSALSLPLRQGPNGHIQYQASDGSYHNLNIRLDGWDAFFTVTFYH